jgi:hypothetical protein
MIFMKEIVFIMRRGVWKTYGGFKNFGKMLIPEEEIGDLYNIKEEDMKRGKGGKLGEVEEKRSTLC